MGGNPLKKLEKQAKRSFGDVLSVASLGMSSKAAAIPIAKGMTEVLGKTASGKGATLEKGEKKKSAKGKKKLGTRGLQIPTPVVSTPATTGVQI